jgi:hypothetical protein
MPASNAIGAGIRGIKVKEMGMTELEKRLLHWRNSRYTLQVVRCELIDGYKANWFFPDGRHTNYIGDDWSLIFKVLHESRA